MTDAWQSQDLAPTSSSGGISIPSGELDVSMTNSNEDRRRSRSRSPVREDSRRDRDRGRRGDGDSAPNPGNNLHVSGLTTKVQNEDLERVFSTAGRVQRASVMYDPHTRESRGFGFVTMETPEEAEAAINALNATEQWGKIIGVEKARRSRARTPTPGKYHGPPKRGDYERPYDPRPYDSRYARDYYDDRDRRGRHDEYRGGRRHDEYRGRRYDDRREDRRHDDRRDHDRGYDRKYDDRRY
ncbi:RNA-binding domain-containing [Pyrrhoderma noxium]|uniref:RNA-binding domain-containing n=1 Tax=Pyrrhoderma noxium TaxID=2282107 RepID=A0A286USQ1_9AGAM|nr:RNA-binding domain-containing [Pyrrhoderma noxium]